MKNITPRYAVSRIWSGINRVARYARARDWIESKRLPVRTIGIGNLQAGGTGKTPLTIRIARDAVKEGLQVAVLTRGYRSQWEGVGGMIIPGEPAPSPALCGDEAALLRDQVPEAWIGVGANRILQFECLHSAASLRTGRGFDLVLLDDAFQHWKIRCDRYVVAVTDAQFGERFFREDFSVVSAEDLVVLTKGDAFPAQLASHPRKARIRYRVPAPDAQQGRYRFVAALGDPEEARASLSRAGYAIVGTSVFPDHHEFQASEVERILNEAKAVGETVLLTGKDWVKWRGLGVSPEQVEFVEPEIEFVEGEDVWRRFLSE